MRIWITSAIVALVSLALTSNAPAQCSAGAKQTADSGNTCQHDKSTCAKTSNQAGKEACKDKSLAATGMPAMHYKVGDQTTCCPKAAAELAAAHDATIRYVVNDTEYADKAEALQAYAKALDEHLGTMTSVRYAVGDKCVACPMAAGALAKNSGETVKYRVAAFTFADKAAAEQAATAARSAADKVSMTMVVDGKETKCDAAAKKSCDTAAGDTAQGKTCEYKVGGTTTPCATTAKVELAKARIEAAQKALEEIAAKDNSGKEVAIGA